MFLVLFVDSSTRGPIARIRRGPRKGDGGDTQSRRDPQKRDGGDAPSRRGPQKRYGGVEGGSEEVKQKWNSSVVVSASIVISNMLFKLENLNYVYRTIETISIYFTRINLCYLV